MQTFFRCYRNILLKLLKKIILSFTVTVYSCMMVQSEIKYQSLTTKEINVSKLKLQQQSETKKEFSSHSMQLNDAFHFLISAATYQILALNKSPRKFDTKIQKYVYACIVASSLSRTSNINPHVLDLIFTCIRLDITVLLFSSPLLDIPLKSINIA